MYTPISKKFLHIYYSPFFTKFPFFILSFFVNLLNNTAIPVIILLIRLYIILNVTFSIFIKITRSLVNIFTIILLSVVIYISKPIINPKNTNIRNSPLLKYHILYKTIIPVKIQNKMSCIYVARFEVFILLLKILKK